MNDKKRIYLIEVHDEKSNKKIRIEDEDVEVVSRFSK
jgi:hypothetical protein